MESVHKGTRDIEKMPTHLHQGSFSRRTFMRQAGAAAAVTSTFAPSIAVADVGAGLSPASQGFIDMVFSNTPQVISAAPFSLSTILDGAATVDSGGNASGTITVDFGDGSSTTLSFASGTLVATTTGGVLDFGAGSQSQYDFNSSLISVGTAASTLLSDGSSFSSPASYSSLGRCMVGALTLACTGVFQANVLAAQAAGGSEPAWWCKGICGTASVLLAALVAAGCGALAAACGAGGTITLGALTIVCAPLVNACTAGAIATAPLAYTWLVANAWN